MNPRHLAALPTRRVGLTLGAVLASGVAAGGDREIVTHGGPRLTYATLKERIHRLGDALHGLGVREGARVAWVDWDTHRYLEAYFAVPMLGATLMTANVRLSPAQLRYTLEHSNASVIVAAAEFVPLLEQALREAGARPRVLVIGEPGSVPESVSLALAGHYEALLEAANPDFAFPETREDAVATQFYTTGTTGHPKGVSYTHQQLVEHTLAVGLALAAASDYQSLRRGDVYMPLTPMFHVHAWGMPYIATLLGLKQVYPGRYDARALPELVARERVTFSHCVPTILQMVLDEAERQDRRLEAWKVMIGGSAMAPALAARAMDRGIHVFAGYGMSETCPVVCFARVDTAPAENLESLCRAGQPVPLVQATLSDATGSPEGTRGELALRAPWLAAGYAGDETATQRLWEGGWLHTGDVAVIESDGAIRIVDRLKDVIKSGGEWVSSLDLEARLREHPAVEEAAVIGVPDEKWGERPRAFVRLAVGVALSEEQIAVELRALLERSVRAGSLPKFAIPDRFRFVSEIPKTSVGKLDKKQLRVLEIEPTAQTRSG